jgi:hypothetical protein
MPGLSDSFHQTCFQCLRLTENMIIRKYRIYMIIRGFYYVIVTVSVLLYYCGSSQATTVKPA